MFILSCIPIFFTNSIIFTVMILTFLFGLIFKVVGGFHR